MINVQPLSVHYLCASLLTNVECSDVSYSTVDYENQSGKEKVASTVPDKTIQITVEQETAKYAN